jgi:hypothetical protein
MREEFRRRPPILMAVTARTTLRSGTSYCIQVVCPLNDNGIKVE